MPDKFIIMLKSSTSFSDRFQHCATIIVAIYLLLSWFILIVVGTCTSLLWNDPSASSSRDHRWDTTIDVLESSFIGVIARGANRIQRRSGIFIDANIHIKRFVNVRSNVHIGKLKVSSFSPSSVGIVVVQFKVLSKYPVEENEQIKQHSLYV